MNPKDFSVKRSLITFIAILLAVGAYVIGYRTTQIDPIKLITSLPKGREIIGELLHPDLTTRKTSETTLDLIFPVPCGSVEPVTAPQSGPSISTNVPCANPRDVITVQGSQMVPNDSVKLQWLLPSGNTLFSKLAKTDANGSFTAQVEVRPINATANGTPSHLQAVTKVPMGGIIPSQALKDVVNELMVTIFMALLATTAGTMRHRSASGSAQCDGQYLLGKRFTISVNVLNITVPLIH
jgi:ABC-type phosphate/phosphonate transport system permease subunit